MEIASGVYKPRDPRTTALYELVRANLETLYGAIEDGAIASNLFDRLLGDDVAPRREFIEKNAKYVKNLDI